MGEQELLPRLFLYPFTLFVRFENCQKFIHYHLYLHKYLQKVTENV
jgi:hypothetical protein